MKNKIFYAIIAIATITACTGNKKEGVNTIITQSDKKTEFSLPQIPQNIVQPEARASYFAEHFWDNLNLNDTTRINEKEFVEKNFTNYIVALSYTKQYEAERYIKSFIRKMEGSARWQKVFLKTAEKYLYNAESPLLNEELYIPFAQAALMSQNTTEREFIRYNYQLEVAQKNRPGKRAGNFEYITSDGKKSELYKTAGKQLLVIFHDPLCENCQNIMNGLINDYTLHRLVQAKEVTVLLVYTEGDKNTWEEHKNKYPKEWISAFDKNESIKDKRIYELRAMPSLYLLDTEKNVILKDALPQVVMNRLQGYAGE